jgi:hypothetical protein
MSCARLYNKTGIRRTFVGCQEVIKSPAAKKKSTTASNFGKKTLTRGGWP